MFATEQRFEPHFQFQNYSEIVTKTPASFLGFSPARPYGASERERGGVRERTWERG